MNHVELNLADPESVKANAERLEELRRAELKALNAILAQFEGRRTLWRYIAAGRVFHTTFVAGDPQSSAYLEGQRAMALKVLNDVLDADAERFVEMMKEAKEGKYDEPSRIERK